MEEIKTVIDNTKDWYDLIDTTIKIGLSSVITGIITYKITSKNHSYEIKKIEKNREIEISKEKLNKKFIYFDEAIKETESFFAALTNITQQWNKYEDKNVFLKDLTEDEQEEYIKIDNAYKESKNKASKVARNFRILGLENILATIQEIDSIINTERAGIRLNKDPFIQQPKLRKLYKEVNNLVEIYDKKIKEAFDKLS